MHCFQFFSVSLYFNRIQLNAVHVLKESLLIAMNGQYPMKLAGTMVIVLCLLINKSFFFLVLKEAEPIRYQLLSNCATSRECRLAAEQLRQVFLKHPISSKYYDHALGNNNSENESSSIFKWG